MILATLLAAATIGYTEHPVVWANNYCVYRGFSQSHEEAIESATNANTGGGKPTDFAWELVAQNKTWCGDLDD